jgi:spore coat polysaccharide biosynthesis protein SpsF
MTNGNTSMSTFKTEQEQFWAGHFGREYSERNRGAHWIASNTAMFARVLAHAGKVESVLELGANIGLNLRALRHLLPGAVLGGVEINPEAAAELRQMPEVEVHQASILDFQPPRTSDLVFTKGVLIHINPDQLDRVYDLMHRASSRLLLVAEYYNPTPVNIPYRGHQDRLFKRDFAGDLRRKFPALQLVDYGFVYHADPHFPQDDLTWFLLEKPAGSPA